MHDLPLQEIGLLPCLLQVPCPTKLLEKGNSPLLRTSSDRTSIHVTPPKTTVQLHWQAARSNGVTHANDSSKLPRSAVDHRKSPTGGRHLLIAPISDIRRWFVVNLFLFLARDRQRLSLGKSVACSCFLLDKTTEKCRSDVHSASISPWQAFNRGYLLSTFPWPQDLCFLFHDVLSGKFSQASSSLTTFYYSELFF